MQVRDRYAPATNIPALSNSRLCLELRLSLEDRGYLPAAPNSRPLQQVVLAGAYARAVLHGHLCRAQADEQVHATRPDNVHIREYLANFQPHRICRENPSFYHGFWRMVHRPARIPNT